MHEFPEDLMNGYQAFRSGNLRKEQSRYLELAEKGQSPKTMLIACCDSRSAPETIFNARPGELFVVRNVANLVQPYSSADKNNAASAAIEFAVHGLKVKQIVVMGHGRCGGIAASLDPDMKPLSDGDFIGKWTEPLKPLVTKVSRDLSKTAAEQQTALERLSVRNSVENLRTFRFIAELEAQNKLGLYGAWFDISLGELWTMDNASGEFLSAVV